MTRSVDATLAAAMLLGAPRPYVKGSIGYGDGTVLHTGDVLSYKLTGQTLEFETDYHDDFAGDQTHIWLERGLSIAGVTYTVTSGRFAIVSQRYLPNGHQVAKGFLFPKAYYSADGYHSYSNILSSFCTAMGLTSSLIRPADAYWAYIFYPSGKYVLFSDANKMLALLRQKYLIFAVDGGVVAGNPTVKFYHARAALGAEDFTFTPNSDFWFESTNVSPRQYIWKDENSVTHTYGTVTDPLHNLGYLESGASAPLRTYPQPNFEMIIRPNFAITDGDIVRVVLLGSEYTFMALVLENYIAGSKGKPPIWQTIVKANPFFANTEGGAIESVVAHTGNYVPVSSLGSHQFSAADNNIQAALETLDGHEHTEVVPLVAHAQRTVIAAGGTAYTFPTMDGLTTTNLSIPWPTTGTLRNLRFGTANAQPGTGTLVCTVMINGGASSIVATDPAGGAAGTYTDLTHSASIAAGQTIQFRFVNNAPAANSAQIGGISLEFDSSTI